MEAFIHDVRRDVQAQAPELLNLFDIHANESRFGRQWLEEELSKLRPEDKLLEVGAGMLLLACQLKHEGFAVTALEPVGEGFTHFYRLQQCVLAYAKKHGILPEILPVTGEELAIEKCFAFAYSLNVMEHVADVEKVIVQVTAALTPGGTYRFLCPNYAFPFETHFAIPAFGSKKLTWFLMRRWIERSAMPDAAGVWASLNWITVGQVKRICRRLNITPFFYKNILRVYIERALYDKVFQARHPILGYIFEGLRKAGLLTAACWIPARFMPVMDCRIQQKA